MSGSYFFVWVAEGVREGVGRGRLEMMSVIFFFSVPPLPSEDSLADHSANHFKARLQVKILAFI